MSLIAHFSDVHFTRNPADFPLSDLLLSKRGLGWLNLRMFGRYDHFLEVETVVAALIEDLATQNPDLTVFTGDLTAVAYPDEFERALKAFGALGSEPRFLGIPGNHDLYVRSADGARRFRECLPAWSGSDAVVSSEDVSGPLLRLVGEDVAVVAVNSARPRALYDSSGVIGAGGLAALDELLADPRLRERRRIVALHYGPRLRDDQPDRRFHGLRDAEAFLDLCQRREVDLVIHGHLHRRFVLEPSSERRLTIANAGSLTDSGRLRCYHLYQLGPEGLNLRVRRYEPETGAFEAWDDAPGAGSVLLPR